MRSLRTPGLLRLRQRRKGTYAELLYRLFLLGLDKRLKNRRHRQIVSHCLSLKPGVAVVGRQLPSLKSWTRQPKSRRGLSLQNLLLHVSMTTQLFSIEGSPHRLVCLNTFITRRKRMLLSRMISVLFEIRQSPSSL